MSFQGGSRADTAGPLWETAAWLKGKKMRANCELVLVRSWRDDVYVLLCLDPAHDSHSRELAELRQRGIPASWENTVEFGPKELALLHPILAETPESERPPLVNALLTLKQSFGGRVLSTDEFRQQVDSLLTVRRGSRSPAESPAKINGSSAPATVRTSSPRASEATLLASKEHFSHLSKAAAHSPMAHAPSAQDRLPWEDEAPTTTPPSTSPAPSMSFADRLKKLARESGTPPAGTP